MVQMWLFCFWIFPCSLFSEPEKEVSLLSNFSQLLKKAHGVQLYKIQQIKLKINSKLKSFNAWLQYVVYYESH